MTETDTHAAARAYARIRYRLLLVNLAAGLAFLALVQWSGASRALARWWADRLASEPLRLLGYLAVFGLAYYLVMLPLHVYGSFRLEHRFGLSRMTLTAWGIREAKALAVSAVVGAVLFEALYALLRHVPASWPLWAAVAWVGLSVVMARIFPTVLLPIFYKTTPLQDEGLSRRLLALCRRAGLEALGVFRFNLGAETRKANAALAGLGATRRVLLADTLLAEFPPEEIAGVLAHELAHHRYQHITKLLVVSAIGSWVAFRLTALIGHRWVAALGLQGLADIAGFPVLMLWFSLLGLVSLPLQNGLSRYFERQADRFAVEVTEPSAAYAAALRRLGALNLADPRPPRWVVWLFYDHPPIPERVRAAENIGDSHSFP
ncbi:MAG: M48 family metallopeptidase [Candidatus Omnitrophica bacterium]|nr:M48 family metallopeptidase [Candidatus Omnitrophota bacterium]